MAEVIRAELWSDIAPAAGVRRGILSQPLSLTETVNLQGEHTVMIEIAFDHHAVVTPDTPAGESNVEGGRVIRLVRSNGEWTEHRIIENVRVFNPTDGYRRRIVAQSIWLDLASLGIVARFIGGSNQFGSGQWTTSFEALGLRAQEHWDQFIYPTLVEGGAPWWELDLDEIHPLVAGQPVDIVYDQDTPLAALLKIAQALGGLEMGMEAGDERYAAVFRNQVGEEAETLVVRPHRNLESLSYGESRTDQATRIYPVGPEHEAGRATVGEAEWRLSGAEPIRAPHPTLPGSLQLATLTLVDQAGGLGPIQFENQWADPGSALLWMTWTTVDFGFDIHTTNPATQQVTVICTLNQAIPFQNWHRVRIVRHTAPPIAAGLADVAFVDHPEWRDRSDVLAAHVEVPNVPPTNNLLPNPLMRDWPFGATLPTGWVRSSSTEITVARATGPGEWDTAGQALRATMTSSIHQIVSPFTLVSRGARGFVSFFVRLKVISGAVKVDSLLYPLIIEADGSIVGGSSPSLYPDTGDPIVGNVGLDVWEDLGVEHAFNLADPALVQLPNGVFACLVRIRPVTVPCEVLVDAAQVTNTFDQRPLLEGNGGVRLLQAANERLARYAEPASRLDADLLDLAALDPEAFPYDALVLGGGVRVINTEMEVDLLTRILGWQRDHLRRANTRVDISTARSDLTSLLAQRPPPPRGEGFR